MTKPRFSTKIVSGLLSATLAVLSGALPAAPALAAELTAAPALQGMPSGSWTPMIQTLASPANLSRFSGVTISGVDVAEVLTRLSRVDLDAQGQLLAAPVLERLAALPKNASEQDVVAAIAAAAAQSRADADAVLAEIKAGFPASRLPEIEAKLKKADLAFGLLTPGQRSVVTAASTAIAQERGQARSDDSTRIIRVGVAGWNKAASDVPVAASESILAQGQKLAPATPRPTPADKAIPAAKPAPAKTSSFSFKKAGRIVLIATAIPLALFALPHMSPVAIAIAAGVMGSVVLHETAHLFMLKRLGDDTATKQNFSANPLKLIDPVGTIAVPILTSAIGAAFGLPVLFGWAKPVPVDFNKLANPQKDAMKVALAGPAMNAVLAGLGFAALALFHPTGAAAAAILSLAKINVLLAAFNMLPLPQLDGGKVVVGMLPARLYKKWTDNARLPEAYRSTFTKLYEGPSWLLNLLGMDGQGRVNMVTRAITIGAFGLFALAGHAFIGAPLLLFMLVCSYDYYCIREKIQNEEAVQRLIPIMQGMGSAIARIAEEDDSIQSEINTEEIEHAMKNVFEDILDKVIDSAGFEGLTDDERWARFEEAYLDAAVDSLSRKGMSKDSKDKIREVLRHRYVQQYMSQLREWIKNEDVWRKWHSPKRKAKNSPAEAAKKKIGSIGGSGVLSIIGVALIGASLLAPHMGGAALATAGVGLMVGSVAPRKLKGFKESLQELRLADKDLAAMLMLLKDMTLAEKPPLSGRIDELSRAYSGVTGPRGIKESVALVGKPGTGKTAIVEKLAQATVMGQSHEGALSLKKMDGRYVIEVNSTRLMRSEDPAGMLEALMETLNKLNDEDPRAGNKVILFLDEAHVLFDGEKGKHVANTLKKPVRDGAVSIILATTLDEYKKYVEPDEALKRRFPAIYVDESTSEETLRALENASAWYEQRFGVKVDPSALKAAAELAPKFNHEEFLPGSAFTYFENAVKWADFDLRRDLVALAIADKMSDLQYAMKKLKEQLQKTQRVTENLKKDEPTTVEFYNLAIRLSQELVELYREQRAIPTEGKPVVDGELVGMAISRETGIKSGQLTLGGEPIEKYLNMEEEVGKRVIGQPEAISAIARSVRQNKAGLSDPKRPLGVYYLTGPTGSGKTHLAKELARFLFDDPEAVVRVDMSEYMESHSVAKFIGSPPGYVGFESGGQLTEAVRKKPYSVVLFDEIEKAHPAVWLMMLQILGEGRLTDGQGKTTSFKNTIILMTSNLGMRAIEDQEFLTALGVDLPAVNIEAYVQEFNALRAQERAAAGDRVALREIEQKKLALAERLSTETKKLTDVVTAKAFQKTYPPEFEGRLSAPPISFNRITPAMAKDIAELNLKELRDVLGFAGHEFLWTEGVKKKIVDEGFSIRLGARPLQNAIDRLITQNIATEILKTAQRNGGKIEPSSIQAVLDPATGEIKLNIAPLPPKQVTKASAQGAARDLFTTVLETTLTAAAETAAPAPAPTIQLIDGWIKNALTANPEAATPEETASPASAAAQPDEAQVAAAPAAAPNIQAPGVLTLGAPSLTAGHAQTFTAAHNDPERKDASVKQAAQAVVDGLRREGYPDNVAAVLTRTIEDQADPYVGWLKVFVEQAKRGGPTPPTVAVEIDGSAARVSITRAGALGARERELLTRHFTGFAPLDAFSARKRAETLNLQDSGSGMRLMLDLHRVLARIPGAKMGVYEVGGNVEYWIEIPKPAPPPAPPAAQPPPETAQAAEPPAPSATSAGRPLVAAAGGAPQWDGIAKSAPLIASKRGLSDDQIKAQAAQLKARMNELAYDGEARGATSLFLVRVADFMKARAQQGESIQVRWTADAQGLQLLIHKSGGALSDADVQQLTLLIESSTELKAKLEATGGRVFHGSGELAHGGAGSSIWLQIPHTGPVSQGDGQAAAASSRSEASTGASERGDAAAAVMAKIAAAANGELSSDPQFSHRELWVKFLPGRHNGNAGYHGLIEPLLTNGRFIQTNAYDPGDGYQVLLRGPDTAAVAQAALTLAAADSIASIKVHSDVRQSLALRASAANPAAAASPASDAAALLGKIHAATEAGSDPRVMWVEFAEAAHEQVLRLRDAGFSIPVTQLLATFKRAQLVAPDAAAAARAAIVLAANDSVRFIEVHPSVRAQIRTTPAADLSARPEGFTSVELDRLAPNHEDTELQNAKASILRLAPPGSDANLSAALTRFLHEAARKAKDGAAGGDKIFVDWRAAPDQLEVAVRRTGSPVNGLDWTGWAAGSPMAAELSAAGAQLAVEGGANGGRFLLVLPAPRVTSGTAPAAPARATRATPQFKRDMVRLMRELMRQRAQRGLALRYSAADIVAAAASSEDLDWARNDWIRFDSDLEESGPQIAAAGMVIAKFGSRADDEERVISAMKRFSETTSWDHRRPARTRLMRSLAKMLTPGNDRQLAGLQARYDRQKEPGLPRSEKLHADVVLAMQMTLLRNAGRDQFENLVTRDWDRRVMAETYDYVKRVNPDYLLRIYEDWKSGERPRQPNGIRKLLAFWAIADHGDRSDMAAIVQAAREDSWMGSSLGLEEKNLLGEALGRMAQRLDYDDALKRDMRLWMREGMGTGGSYLRMVTAVQVVGAVGGLHDLPLLERIVRSSPEGGGVSVEHEMTQYEAALAWGKIVQREGLVPEYWSVKQNPDDPNSLPLLQDWLSHVNSAVNMAAAEAIAAFLKHGSPARRPSASEAPAAPEHPFLRMGPNPDGDAEQTYHTHAPVDPMIGTTSPLSRLASERRALAEQWGEAVGELAHAVLGVAFDKQVRMRDPFSGTSLVLYVLKEAVGQTVSVESIARAREMFLLLLSMASDAPEVRERKLADLAERYPTIRAAYAALAALAAIPGVTMGIDRSETRATSLQRGQTELWLRFEVPHRPAAQRPLFPVEDSPDDFQGP